MSKIEGWWARLRPWLRRRAVEREMDDELAFHLERETAKLRETGLSADAAARQARIRFGGTVRYREEVRDSWTGRLGGVGGDMRRAVRRVASRPGLTTVAVVTLGLGIGANTAIFSLVRSALFSPLPYDDVASLVVLWNRAGDLGDDTWMSQRELVEYRRGTQGFASIAAYTELYVNLSDGEPERVQAAFVSDNLFETLGTEALVGRTIGAGDAEPGGAAVAMLGHGVWQRQFGGRTDIVGETIRISGRPAVVVGVMPAGFRLPLDYRDPRPTEVFLADSINTARELPWGDRSYFLVARLAPGVTTAAATESMRAAHQRWKADVAELADDDLDSRVPTPVRDLLFREIGQALSILFVAVGLLLLIACANVAHLLLASGDARRRELSTQAVLGASRRRLITQLLSENVVIAGLGAGVGVLSAYAIVQAAMAWAPANAIRMSNASLDVTVLLFTAVVALAATLVAGIVPALTLSRAKLTEALAAGRGVAGERPRAPRRLLVVAEMALSLVLVLSAVLLVRSYAALRSIDLGYDTANVATIRVDLPPAEYQGRALQFFKDAVNRLEAVPGVRSAGAVRVLPLSNTIGDWSITLEHRPSQPGENPNGDWQVVTPGYFEAMQMQLVRGRLIQAADDENTPIVAVVSETMADRYWPGQDALGKRFHLGTLNQPWIEIVGIARTIRHNAVVEEPRAEMYLPHAQWPRATGGGSPRYGMTFVARTEGDPRLVLPRLREELRALDSRLPASDARTMDAVAAEALAEPRFTTLLLGGFALVALTLAGVGLYGVVSFNTARRTREIGVRMALGARPATVCLLVIGDSLALTGLGVALGLAVAFWATRWISGQLYGVSALDPVTFVAVPAALVAVSTLAAWIPARRAVRTSPVEALRLD